MPKEMVEKYKIKMEYWEPIRIEKDGEMMPIITAMFPEGNAAFNVNEMGRKVIKSKMVKGEMKPGGFFDENSYNFKPIK
jgi:poly(A) polymerase Pap1